MKPKDILNVLRMLWDGFVQGCKVALKAVQFQPFWRTFAEVLLAVTFTFGPFLLLSVPLSEGKGSLDVRSIGANFWSFFDSGEIALPILSLCGAITAIAFTRRRALNEVLFFFALCAPVIVATIASYAIGDSDKFGQPLYPAVTVTGFLIYAMLLLLWGVLGHQANSEIDVGNPEQRAAEILKNARAKRSRSPK